MTTIASGKQPSLIVPTVGFIASTALTAVVMVLLSTI
jgi:hypothetical protein